MPNDKQALNLFKTYMVLGPDYQPGRQPKPILPKSIVHNIMQYAQYEDWMETAKDLAALLNRDDLDFITQSESWAQDPSLNDAKKWLANPDNNPITESYDIVEKSIMPLVKFIAKSPLVGEDGMTALMWAAGHGHIKALKALVAVPGIDVNAASKGGLTALICAAGKGHTEILMLLLEVPGININALDKQGWTALMAAACNGHTEALKVLLEVPGIDVSATDINGLTALMHAANNGRTQALKTLLSVPGINVNAKNIVGSTALMWTASYDHIETLKALLATPGIDVTAVNRANMTALNWATRNGHTEAARLINEHLAQSKRSNQNKRL